MCALELAVVRRECGFSLGGAERYCAGVVKGLAGRGINITVIADTMESDVRLSTGARVKYERAAITGRGSLMKNMSFFMSVRHVLENHDFDLVYGLSRITDADILRISDPLHAAWLKLGYPQGLFSFLRRFSPRHNSLLSIERRSVLSARMILTNSRLVAEQVRHFYGVSPEMITTIYNGFDPMQFHPVSEVERKRLRQELSLPLEGDIILFAGTNFSRKGLEPLLRALSSVAESREFCLVVTGARNIGVLESVADEMGIFDRIITAGYVREMAKYYQASDLFVLPTLYDPFANTCLESAACGTPVITTAMNGAAELVAKVNTDFVVERADEALLSEAILSFLQRTDADRDEVRHGFVRLASAYTWEKHIDGLLQLFASLHIKASEMFNEENTEKIELGAD